MEAPFDVFLSHNSKDKPTVRQLAEALQRRGLKVWLDEEQLVPGHPWQEALEEIIRTTRSVAVLVGMDGMGPWEMPEMRGCLSQFIKRRLPVIPVLLPDAPGQPDLPLFLEGFTWVDLRAGGLSDANLDRLEWGITGRKPVPRPVVSKPPPEPSSEPVKKPEIPIAPPKESKTRRNWLIGFAVIALIGLLLGVITRMQTSPPVTPLATTTPQRTPPTKDSTLPPSGQEFQDKLKDGSLGPKMVVIPAGTFLMGSPESETGRNPNERQHPVSIKSFAIGKYEVTVEQFLRFAEVTGYRTEAETSGGCYYMDGGSVKRDSSKTWRSPGFVQSDAHPVVCVSWNDAVAYTEWLSNQTGQRYRLPTEAEWEYAARAGTQTAYWWGVTIGSNRANCDGCGSRWDNEQTAPVGSFPANLFGLYDTAGNVWEWTCSEYDKDYEGKEQICTCSETASPCVLRGGSWGTEPRRVRGAARARGQPLGRLFDLGFRLART